MAASGEFGLNTALALGEVGVVRHDAQTTSLVVSNNNHQSTRVVVGKVHCFTYCVVEVASLCHDVLDAVAVTSVVDERALNHQEETVAVIVVQQFECFGGRLGQIVATTFEHHRQVRFTCGINHKRLARVYVVEFVNAVNHGVTSLASLLQQVATIFARVEVASTSTKSHINTRGNELSSNGVAVVTTLGVSIERCGGCVYKLAGCNNTSRQASFLGQFEDCGQGVVVGVNTQFRVVGFRASSKSGCCGCRVGHAVVFGVGCNHTATSCAIHIQGFEFLVNHQLGDVGVTHTVTNHQDDVFDLIFAFFCFGSGAQSADAHKGCHCDGNSSKNSCFH